MRRNSWTIQAATLQWNDIGGMRLARSDGSEAKCGGRRKNMSGGTASQSGFERFTAWRERAGWRTVLQMKARGATDAQIMSYLTQRDNRSEVEAGGILRAYYQHRTTVEEMNAKGGNVRPLAHSLLGSQGRVGNVRWWFSVRYTDTHGVQRTMIVHRDVPLGANLSQMTDFVRRSWPETVRERAGRDSRNYPKDGEVVVENAEIELVFIERMPRR